MTSTARIWAIGLGLLGGCASPCEDDGLVQSGQGDCPAGASGNASDSDTDTDTATASASDTVTASDSANSASASNSATDSDSDSASDTDSATASASDTDSATESDSATDTDSGGNTTPYCVDADDDGFGDPADCVDVPDGDDPPDGSVPNAGDCDDGNAQTFPGAAENDSEDECMQDEDEDGWGDDAPPKGVTPGSDCDDADLATFPGAAELDSETACMQDEDEDGWGDDAPADGVTPGSDCSDDGVDPCAVLITQDGTNDNPYDQSLTAALQMDGYEVLNFADTDVVLEDANGVDVVVVSETALSTEIAGTMQNTLAPVVCLEGLIWDDMGMAPEASVTSTDDILIVDDGNPLAAGLTGSHSVVAGVGAGLFFVAAPVGAESVVSVDGNPANIVEFAFEGGASMLDGFEAPARRVGLGFDADQGANPTTTILAPGIALFRAAVAWATDG